MFYQCSPLHVDDPCVSPAQYSLLQPKVILCLPYPLAKCSSGLASFADDDEIKENYQQDSIDSLSNIHQSPAEYRGHLALRLGNAAQLHIVLLGTKHPQKFREIMTGFRLKVVNTY